MSTTTLADYKKSLGRIADQLADPNINLEIASVAAQHGKGHRDVYQDLRHYYPVQWYRAKNPSISRDRQQDSPPAGPIERHAAGLPLGSLGDALRALGIVTEESVAMIKSATYKYRKIIPEGQLMVMVGKANSGKTTVMEYIASKIDGEVLYLNMDISSAHIPDAFQRAQQGGYDLICPDLSPNGNIADVLRLLEIYAERDADLADFTLIIDTLKKIADLLSKSAVKKLMQILRALTARGATVVCLAHTNKYEQGDGKDRWPVYEGVGDLRNDCDAMVALIGYRGDYDVVTTSLYWAEQGWPHGKDRGEVEAASWEIDRHDGRSIKELEEWIDTQALVREAQDVKKYSDLIRDIYSYLNGTPNGDNQSQVVLHLKGQHSQKQVIRCLKRYTGTYWTEDHALVNNAILYRPVQGVRLPA